VHSEIYRFLDSMGKWQGGLFCVDLAAEFERFIDPTEVSNRVAAGVLAMRRRYSSDGSRGRRRGRRASGGSRDDSRASSTSA